MPESAPTHAKPVICYQRIRSGASGLHQSGGSFARKAVLEIQKYVQGEMIYIPKPKHAHEKWGVRSRERKWIDDGWGKRMKATRSWTVDSFCVWEPISGRGGDWLFSLRWGSSTRFNDWRKKGCVLAIKPSIWLEKTKGNEPPFSRLCEENLLVSGKSG
jgi:hypothetical protein